MAPFYFVRQLMWSIIMTSHRAGCSPEPHACCLSPPTPPPNTTTRSTMSWFTPLLTYCLACVLFLESVYKNIKLLSHRAASCSLSWAEKCPCRNNISRHALRVSNKNIFSPVVCRLSTQVVPLVKYLWSHFAGEMAAGTFFFKELWM